MSTILIIEALPILRAGLRAIIHGMNPVAVVHELPTMPDIAHSLPTPLDLVILGVNSTPSLETSIPAKVRTLRQHSPQVPILFFGSGNTQLMVSIATQHQIEGYVDRYSDETTLKATMHAVLNGMQCLPRYTSAGKLPKKFNLLSVREMQILILLRQGIRNKDAARRLHLSEKTISTHKINILRKLGIQSLNQIQERDLSTH